MNIFKKAEDETTTKKCPHCQTDIPTKAKRCPHCQSDLRQWINRHPILTLIGLFIGIPLIVGWIMPSHKNSSPGTSTPTSTSTAQEQAQPLLDLQSLHCYKEYDYFIIEGTVKNISNSSMESILAVGKTYTATGEFVKSDSALIEYNPILAKQTSPFKVIMTGNPAIEKCAVDFKEFWGGTIMTKDSWK